MKQTDIAIIGGGIGALMAAYRLTENAPSLSVTIYEKGSPLMQRVCPAAAKKIPCCHCKVCSITSGLAGAGAFSDGKFNLGTNYGGTLGEALGEDEAMEYINAVDAILHRHAPDENNYPPVFCSNDELKLKCLQNNLRLLDMDVRHLGTDRNKVIMDNLINAITAHGIDIVTGVSVNGVNRSDGEYKYTLTYDGGVLCAAKKVIIATGRSGSELVRRVCADYGIQVDANAVDLGVRIELPDVIWRGFSDKIYEPKIICRTKTFEDTTRMFCFNAGGIVSAENNNGIISVNGHAFSDKSKKTSNCNFSILSSVRFTQPFNQPTEYVESIARLVNSIGSGNVLVQRFGDLIRGRRTNEHRLGQNSVRPTLKATPGDLSLVLPHRILTNIIETIQALDKVAPGTANDDTLLYGAEAKYYSIKPRHNGNFEITEDMYLIGDGSGVTRGLSQAGAMGLFVADCISGARQE